ncbi:MAG: hypothetical protein J0I20_16175 [Chloroflexi bacterium]|nr:hypothetical protein [Chloroflexota bacterium]OJV88693.1 MAG: hypothetical protein BGO39_04070 [Chloroflexi bacterium 54-19]
MSGEQNGYSRLADLRERCPDLELQDPEIFELYNLEKRFAPTPYGEIVAVLSTFPPYLTGRPHLIVPFVAALYRAGQAAFRGITDRESLRELLLSKSQVDANLRQALQLHPAEFERGLAALPQ